MTERGQSRVERSEGRLAIGPSTLQWDGATLTIGIDEIAAPWPQRVRGTVRVTPASLCTDSYALDATGRHRWVPIAPCAHVEVDLAQPASRWRGAGYFDSNFGSGPLEGDFRRWHWSRARSSDGRTAVLYDVTRNDGSDFGLALRFDPRTSHGEAFAPPPPAALPHSAWGVARSTRSDAGTTPRITSSLEDGPFYARSVVQSALFGAPAHAVHESLDLERFAAPWVQAMLPFRMPRRT